MQTIQRHFTTVLQARLQEELNFMQVVVGPRQVGKTTGLKQVVKAWPGPSLMITADEVATPNQDWLVVHWERARQMGKGGLFVIDEVQKIPQWSSMIKYLYDQDRESRAMKVVLLGSASLSLQRGLAESLAGRYEVICVSHWNLQECEEALNWSLEDFLKFGGYPAAGELVQDISRWQGYIRNSVIDPVLIKDILGLTSVHKPALFRQTFELAMAYPAQEVSLQKLLGQLQESGNVHTIRHYLELFEGAFLVKVLQKYSGSEMKKRSSSPKILPLNTALVHAFRSPVAVETNAEWAGRIFEAAVGAALSRTTGKLYYWREGAWEVDFVLQWEDKVYALEVKSRGRGRGRGLERFIHRYPGSIPVIVDRSLGEQVLRAEDVDVLFSDNQGLTSLSGC